MHISGKITIPIGVVLLIIAGLGFLSMAESNEDLLHEIGPDETLSIKLYDEDGGGEYGFSFWIEGDYTDADDNGLWDDCESFNANVSYQKDLDDDPENATNWYRSICNQKHDRWDSKGLIKVGHACETMRKDRENDDNWCKDGDYVITSDADGFVQYEDRVIGDWFGKGLVSGCCCCFGLIIILLGVVVSLSMQPSTSVITKMEFSSGDLAPTTIDGEAQTVPDAVFGDDPPAQGAAADDTSDEESIESSVNSLKEKFLAAAADKVEDAGEAEKE